MDFETGDWHIAGDVSMQMQMMQVVSFASDFSTAGLREVSVVSSLANAMNLKLWPSTGKASRWP